MPARELRDLRARARGASPKNSKICKMQRKKEKKKKKRKKIAIGHVVKDTTFEVPFDPPFVIAMKHLE